MKPARSFVTARRRAREAAEMLEAERAIGGRRRLLAWVGLALTPALFAWLHVAC